MLPNQKQKYHSKALSYDEIFNHRGNLYDLAMQKFPKARELEFKALFYKNAVGDNEKIIDLPSGGAYLKNFTNPCTQIDSWEISQGFVLREGINYVQLGKINTIARKYTRAVCLATLHHIEDKQEFISQLSQTVVKGGIVHVADVADESRIKIFLEEFVHFNNDMGHRGTYISKLKTLPAPSNLEIIRREMVDVPWHFDNIFDAAIFCKLMFGLRAETSLNSIIKALQDYVGITTQGNKASLNWQLQYIDLKV